MRLQLGSGMSVALEPRDDGWTVQLRHADGPAVEAGDGSGAALVGLLSEDPVLPEGWQFLRLGVAPDTGVERAIETDQTNLSVVLEGRPGAVGTPTGDVVVKWLRSVSDRPQPALSALAQLAAVGFAQTPPTYAVLTWTSPHGHVLPIAYVTGYLPGAQDGWTWCVELVRQLASGGSADLWALDFPQRLGVLTGELHAALATPTHVFARPTQAAGPTRPPRWYDGAIAVLEAALVEADPQTAEVIRTRARAISATFDACLGDPDELVGTSVQHIHGDLHVGQILRWNGGLAVLDFDGNPVVEPEPGLLHPVARDVAQMLSSLDHVGQVVLHRSPEADPDVVGHWLVTSGRDFLSAYRRTIRERGFPDLLDERLLPAFRLEQELREVRYASRHLPHWAYAPRATLLDFTAEGVQI